MMMEVKNKSNIAKQMSKWWADHLRDGVLKGYDNMPANVTAMASLLHATENRNIDSAGIDRFQNILEEMILNDLDRSPYFSCGTDYEPDLFLKEAADRAGIELGSVLLPIKSHTYYSSHYDPSDLGAGYVLANGKPTKFAMPQRVTQPHKEMK